MSSDFVPETLNDLTDYYLILDLKPDASPSDIREAYLRAKATFQKDNVALYTLIDGSEREDMLRRIEEAYQVLSNSERRREYDRFYGQLSSGSATIPSPLPQQEAPAQESAKVISIDRKAPIDPVTSPVTSTATPPSAPSAFQPQTEASASSPAPTPSSMLTNVPTPGSHTSSKVLSDLEKEIAEQTEWSGAFIRHVREVRGVSIEEVTQATKITKAYILAIEEENYAKLPAAVFIRGFVSQLARLLRLPAQSVSVGYMARLQRSNPEKFR